MNDLTKRKKALNIKSSCSNGMTDLLLNPEVTTDVAKSYDTYELISQQIQRDLMVESRDKEESWAIVKALGIIQDTMLLFRAEGLADIASEK